ncbi:MAG: hypothetical protein ACKO0X_01240 [Bacteroidota bacterium]
MEINFKTISRFCLAILFIQISQSASAQFRDAIVPGTTYGITPIAAQNTGNDILDVGSTTYSVNVWDDANGPNSGFGWKVGNVIGFTPIGSGALVTDPDIALVKSNSGTVYALVVFHNGNQSNFVLESYQWNVAQQQFTALLPIVLATGTFHRSVNIGANDNGEFAIVWDEPGDLVRLAIGRAQTSIPVIVPIGGAPFADLLPGSQPDVCVYRNSSTGFRQVNVVSKHPGNYLEVDFYRWNDLTSGIINPTPYFRSALPDLSYNNPRIACPPSSGGNQNDFTIVTEDTDGNSTWFIKVMNSNMCCQPNFNSYVYNNGTTGNSPYNTTDVPNSRPVVSYDNAYNMIWVAWDIDNSFGLLTAPGAAFGKFPIALTANKRGRLESQSNYLYVPTGVSFGSNTNMISVSGHRSSTAFFTYMDGNNNQAFFKNNPHVLNTPQLRTTSNTSLGEWIEQLQNISKLQVNWFDLSGRIIESQVISAMEINETELKKQFHLRNGIYLLDIRTLDGLQSFYGMMSIAE